MGIMSLFPIFAAVLLCAMTTVCDSMDSSINRGLEEEKSYTRHAMEYHRQHTEKRAGNPVLETWSTADYIAQAVADQKVSGDWARYTDQLPFLKPSLQKDLSGRPFCAVRRDREIVVIRYVAETKTKECTLQSAGHVDTGQIKSGDMEFSGRTDYWTYSLRLQSGR
jgi:hypothetical protein